MQVIRGAACRMVLPIGGMDLIGNRSEIQSIYQSENLAILAKIDVNQLSTVALKITTLTTGWSISSVSTSDRVVMYSQPSVTSPNTV